MKISKRERKGIIISLIIVSSALIVTFIIEPCLKEWKQLNNEIMNTKLGILKANLLLKDYPRLVQKDKILSCELASITTRFWQEKQKLEILSQLEEEAKKTKINIVNITPIPIKKFQYHEEFDIQIQTVSNINFLSEFLYRLVNNDKKVNIISINITSSDNGTVRTNLLISVPIFL